MRVPCRCDKVTVGGTPVQHYHDTTSGVTDLKPSDQDTKSRQANPQSLPSHNLDELLDEIYQTNPNDDQLPRETAHFVLNQLITNAETKARIDELEMLGFIDWESYVGEKKTYDDGTNYIVDEHVEAYAQDRIKQLEGRDE